MADLIEYTVVADAITVTTGNKDHRGNAEVVRMVHGETLNAPANHPSVIEFLAMGGIVKTSEARDTYLDLHDKQSPNRPSVQRQIRGADGETHVLKPYRITGHGVALTMAAHGFDLPEPPVERVLPLAAPNPSTATPDAELLAAAGLE